MKPESMIEREVWGVIGGLGPVASAEFIRTIYELAVREYEQDAPIVILASDPGFPDRTESFLNNRKEVLLERLQASLLRLVAFDVTRIVICCMTIHHLLPLLPEGLQRKIVSLLELTLSAVIQSERRHLLVCSTGSRRVKLFEAHPLWDRARYKIVTPTEKDQGAIHTLIYRLKSNCQSADDIGFLHSLMMKYDVDSFIAACTEFHILSKIMHYSGEKRFHCLDPLMIVAAQIAKGFPSSHKPGFAP